jgi:hypothetical protein
MAEFNPAQSPPPVRTPILLFSISLLIQRLGFKDRFALNPIWLQGFGLGLRLRYFASAL